MPLKRCYFLVILTVWTLAVCSRSNEYFNPVSFAPDGTLKIRDKISFKISSKPHTSNIGLKDKMPLFVMMRYVTITAIKGKHKQIAPWDSTKIIDKYQEATVYEYWVPLAKFVGDHDHFAVLSILGPCDKKDIVPSDTNETISVDLGEPLDGCDILRLEYFKRISKNDFLVFDYLIDPCTNEISEGEISIRTRI